MAPLSGASRQATARTEWRTSKYGARDWFESGHVASPDSGAAIPLTSRSDRNAATSDPSSGSRNPGADCGSMVAQRATAFRMSEAPIIVRWVITGSVARNSPLRTPSASNPRTMSDDPQHAIEDLRLEMAARSGEFAKHDSGMVGVRPERPGDPRITADSRSRADPPVRWLQRAPRRYGRSCASALRCRAPVCCPRGSRAGLC